jgi:hypothetical protein
MHISQRLQLFYKSFICLLFVSCYVNYFYGIPKLELNLGILLFNSVPFLYTVGK